jgi:hypothetical protein
MQLLISPVCGAAFGAAFGLLSGRLALSLLVRNPTAIARAAGKGVEAVTQWALSLKVADIAPDADSPVAQSMEKVVADALSGILGSRATIYAVRDMASRIVAGLAARKLSDLSAGLGIRALLADRLLPALAEEGSRRRISGTAGALVTDQAGAALGDDVLREVTGVFESYLPEAADAAVRWLRSDETRAYLSARGRELLPRILEKLSELQKLFVSAGQFDRRLDEKMPEIVAETIEAAEKMVRDPRQQHRIVDLFFESAQGWRDSLLVTPNAPARRPRSAREKLGDSVSILVDRFLARLDDPSARRSIAEQAEQRLRDDRRTLGAFVTQAFGLRDSDLVELLSAKALSFLVSPDTAREISRTLCGILFSFLRENADMTIRSIFRVHEDKKRRLDEWLRARASRLAGGTTPLMWSSISRGLRLHRLFVLFGAAVGVLVGLVLAVLSLAGGL